jgi:hypothetical protein
MFSGIQNAIYIYIYIFVLFKEVDKLYYITIIKKIKQITSSAVVHNVSENLVADTVKYSVIDMLKEACPEFYTQEIQRTTSWRM